jgi:hypothetical protein
MLARLGETLRMRAYRMNEHAGHALAVWRPFRTCLERHSQMNVLTEIFLRWKYRGLANRTVVVGMRRDGRKGRWKRMRVCTWESEEKASFRGRGDWALAVRSGDDW